MNIELKGPRPKSIFIGSKIYYPDPIILNFGSGPGPDITNIIGPETSLMDSIKKFPLQLFQFKV